MNVCTAGYHTPILTTGVLHTYLRWTASSTSAPCSGSALLPPLQSAALALRATGTPLLNSAVDKSWRDLRDGLESRTPWTPAPEGTITGLSTLSGSGVQKTFGAKTEDGRKKCTTERNGRTTETRHYITRSINSTGTIVIPGRLHLVRPFASPCSSSSLRCI